MLINIEKATWSGDLVDGRTN